MDVFVSQWRRIESFLGTVVGQRGATALYGRCVHFAAVQHPWLRPLEDTSVEVIDLDAFRAVLARQTFDEVADAGDLLLETLYDIMQRFIGQPLTNRLLEELAPPDPNMSAAPIGGPAQPAR